MVEHVSKRIQYGLIMLVVCASFVVWVMVSTNCSDFDSTQVLDANDEKFST